MSEAKTQPVTKTASKREPWRVSARHTPLAKDDKIIVVDAASKDEAWQAYLMEAEKRLREDANKPRKHKRYRSELETAMAQQWLSEAKVRPMPDEVEILPDEYVQRRKVAMRIRGAVTKEQVGGFEELASAKS